MLIEDLISSRNCPGLPHHPHPESKLLIEKRTKEALNHRRNSQMSLSLPISADRRKHFEKTITKFCVYNV